MYLSELKLWNFRKYGIEGDSFEKAEPGLQVKFKKGVNVLVGENDSGKTAIVDAIRYVLRTHSLEYINIDDKDFHKSDEFRANELKIECTFRGFDSAKGEAGHFLEWIGFEGKNFILKVWLYAKRREDNSIYQMVKAGVDADGTYLEGDARNLLRVVYLKPLRDALQEMSQGYKSRLAQILKSHEVFTKTKNKDSKFDSHELEDEYAEAKKKIDHYFKPKIKDEYDPEIDKKGAKIVAKINSLLGEILIQSKDSKASINMSESELPQILRLLNLVLEEDKSGLGTLNLLYMAAELLHLDSNRSGLKLTLIEELEAHLHPQLQLSLIEFIQDEKSNYGQFILTTHSTTLASKINLEKLILCKGNKVYPMGNKGTQLEKGDYKFLERFLDATKANLFFAKGVILVEGDAENLLIPTIAEKIGRPLHKYGVSIVNIGSTAFNRYRKIFLRRDMDEKKFKNGWLGINVAVITDLDVPSMQYWDDKEGDKNVYVIQDENIKGLNSITTEIEWDNLLNVIITSSSDFENKYQANKLVKTLTAGTKEKLDIYFPSLKRVIDRSLIDDIRIQKKEKLKIIINAQNVRAFIAKRWTLEYDLALSCLYKELAVATEIAKRLKANNTLEIGKENIEEISQEINVRYPLTNPDTAYRIFKPLNDGNVSKAATSQCLAGLVNDSEIITKTAILNDSYLKYLCDAIFYVTEPRNEGGEDGEN